MEAKHEEKWKLALEELLFELAQIFICVEQTDRAQPTSNTSMGAEN